MMTLLKHITGFLFSIRTTIWLLVFLIAMLLAGALVMPAKQEFESIHSIPLFEWLKKQPLNLTWWLWCLIGILPVLAINTLFCSIESIIKKRKVTQWLLLISPQVIHIGFLFILLAHLLSAIGGSKELAVAREGSFLKISGNNKILQVRDIDISTDSSGYITDWEVNIEYLSDGKTFRKDKIRPNKPSIQMGLNINVKDLQSFPYEAVLLQISKEPGAVWALIGGVLFMAGIVTLIVLKVKTER